jgi:hyperosmotically inducible periplasmic protein
MLSSAPSDHFAVLDLELESKLWIPREYKSQGENMAANRRFLLSVLFVLMPSTSLLNAASQKQTEPKAEQNLIKEVRHQLVLLPYYSVFDNLSFRVEGSKIVLMGQVVRPSLKSDAEGVVKNVEGVSSVENEIEALPPSPMDDQLRRALFRAIYSEPALSRYAQSAVPSIHIIVKNGNVTLEGVADSETDKNMAGLRANSVPNVFSVKNNLIVTGSSK